MKQVHEIQQHLLKNTEGRLREPSVGVRLRARASYPWCEVGHVNTKLNLPKYRRVKGTDPKRVLRFTPCILDLRTRRGWIISSVLQFRYTQEETYSVVSTRKFPAIQPGKGKVATALKCHDMRTYAGKGTYRSLHSSTRR